MAGLSPQQSGLKGAGCIDGVLSGERGMMLGDGALSEPGQRDLPLRLLAEGLDTAATGRPARIIRHDVN